MKIIYDLEEPLILLTKPVWLHVDRPREKTVTSYPINETPLSLILREDLELQSTDFTTRHLVRHAADVTTTVTLQNMRFCHRYENKFFAKSVYPPAN